MSGAEWGESARQGIIKEGRREFRCLAWRARQGVLNGTVPSSAKDAGLSKDKAEVIREVARRVK